MTNVIFSAQTEIETLSNSASALAGSVLSRFQQDISDLEVAARDQETVAQLAQDEADALIAVRDFALEQADANFAAARGLRVVLGVSEGVL